jgi:lysophospholipase L1-like esterase
LSIEFSGHRPAVSSIEVSPNDSAVTVFLAGNSTVTDQRYEPYSAWGQMLPRFFKPGFVSVANHAESGEALKSFIGENRLEKLLSEIRPGDYVFIQFAHNDQKTQSSAHSAPFTDYKELLKRYIIEARNKGAIPVLVTPMLRRNFDGEGRVVNTHGDYPEAMRQVAEEEQVAMIDLFGMSRTLYEALGPEDSKSLFVHYPAHTFAGQEEELKDNTHHSTYGAYELSKCIVQGIRDNHLELADYLVEGLPEFDPAHPDPFSSWNLPLSPVVNLATPEGR